MVGLALIIASWLNAEADTDDRGRIFAIDMVVNLAAPAVGRLLLSTGKAASVELLALVAILFALSLLPAALVQARTPVAHEPTGLGAGELLRRSPTGVLGCFAVGSPTSTTGVGSSCSPRSRVSW